MMENGVFNRGRCGPYTRVVAVVAGAVAVVAGTAIAFVGAAEATTPRAMETMEGMDVTD